MSRGISEIVHRRQFVFGTTHKFDMPCPECGALVTWGITLSPQLMMAGCCRTGVVVRRNHTIVQLYKEMPGQPKELPNNYHVYDAIEAMLKDDP